MTFRLINQKASTAKAMTLACYLVTVVVSLFRQPEFNVLPIIGIADTPVVGMFSSFIIMFKIGNIQFHRT